MGVTATKKTKSSNKVNLGVGTTNNISSYKVKKTCQNRNSKLELISKIRSLNAITQSEDFKVKTGYNIFFELNNGNFDKIIKTITGERSIKADLVS